MKPTRTHYDAAIVGAGPAGTVAALLLARRGAKVALIEANPKAASRFAGEWIHPPGVAVLERLGIGRFPGTTDHPAGSGFVVFTDDTRGPIELPYPRGALAWSGEHRLLVEGLRAHALDTAGIDYLPGTRLESIRGTALRLGSREHGSSDIQAALVVGADGRGSMLRQHLGLPESTSSISSMAGVELEDVELPSEGMGHVLLGGPGPILMYRIDSRRVRICLDVPPGSTRREAAGLWDAFGPVFPPSLRPAFRRALEERKVAWAANGFRPRVHYRRGSIALVGDAVGHFHPLTAAGMTMAFLDAECLARGDLESYQRTRDEESYVPELLANALYEVFVRKDRSASAIRSAIYDRWRASEFDRDRTMRILSCEAIDRETFGRAFVRMAYEAVRHTGGELARARALRSLPLELASFVEWAQYPLATIVPRGFRSRNRPASRPGTVLPELPLPRLAPSSPPLRPETSPPVTIRPSPEPEDHERDLRFCSERLFEVSRTFVRPIEMLPGDLRTAVTCGYLLCRIADTIEDHPKLPIAERDGLYAAFLDVLERQAPAERFAELWSKVDHQGPEHVLCLGLPRVMRVFWKLPRALQDATVPWVAEMTRGMALYSHRPRGVDGIAALHTPEDLDRYCYYVAGTVGHMLTALFSTELRDLPAPRALVLRENAEAFGLGLQLVNILKDVTDDRERGISFIPRTSCEAQGIGVADLTDPAHRARAHAAVFPIFEHARLQLDRALEYVLALPVKPEGIRLFCLLPLWMAVRTLVHARGNDAMFIADRPVKIARAEVEQLIADCVRFASDDEALRERYARLWLADPFPAAEVVEGGTHA